MQSILPSVMWSLEPVTLASPRTITSLNFNLLIQKKKIIRFPTS